MDISKQARHFVHGFLLFSSEACSLLVPSSLYRRHIPQTRAEVQDRAKPLCSCGWSVLVVETWPAARLSRRPEAHKAVRGTVSTPICEQGTTDYPYSLLRVDSRRCS